MTTAFDGRLKNSHLAMKERIMVRLGFYKVKKTYKRKVRECEEVTLHFPKELHEFLRCLRNHQLAIRANREGKIAHVKLIDKDDQ
jgi:hypothetical protein